MGQEVAVPLGTSVAVTSAEAEAPGAKVTRPGAGDVVLVACAACAPDESSAATPGNPNMVQVVLPVFLKITGTML